MKFFIVGKHASSKHEALNIIEELGGKVAREFSNLPTTTENVYIDSKYLRYEQEDIDAIFNNRTFLTMGPVEECGLLDGYKYYRGIDFYHYDKADALVLSPRQLTNINKHVLNQPTVFVWMDNNRDNRIHKHVADKRTYDFVEVERLESSYDADFVKTIYNFPNSNLIYFNNECPERVACIVYTLIKHPELLDIFIKHFN